MSHSQKLANSARLEIISDLDYSLSLQLAKYTLVSIIWLLSDFVSFHTQIGCMVCFYRGLWECGRHNHLAYDNAIDLERMA